jgi:hypothetical protein
VKNFSLTRAIRSSGTSEIIENIDVLMSSGVDGKARIPRWWLGGLQEVGKLKEAVLAESLVGTRLGTIAAPPYLLLAYTLLRLAQALLRVLGCAASLS